MSDDTMPTIEDFARTAYPVVRALSNAGVLAETGREMPATFDDIDPDDRATFLAVIARGLRDNTNPAIVAALAEYDARGGR